MRSHVVTNSSESDEKFGSLQFGESPNGQSGYGLRENPRKTWRSMDANFTLPKHKTCEQCGKIFQSLKALCGHMACHSERDKDRSWTSHSDTEDQVRIIRTRSSKSKNGSFNNAFSSVSEIVGDEQEEVAMCLMLLSRDSLMESSDNNSVILERKSSPIVARKSVVYKQEVKKIKCNSKLKGGETESAEMENSDSDYFLDECSKAESGISMNGLCSSFAFQEYDKPLMNYQLSIKTPGKYECFNCKKSFTSYQALGGHKPCHKRSNDYYESRYESGENSPDEATELTNGKTSGKSKTTSSHEKKNKGKKSKSHVCPFCDRVFKNGQALGGHKRSHFIGGNRENNSNNRMKKGSDLLDLNLPAPEEERHDQFFSGW